LLLRHAAESDDRAHGGDLLVIRRPGGERVDEDEVRYALRVSEAIEDRWWPGLAVAAKREALKRHVVDNSLEVAQPCLEGEVGDVAI